MSSSTAHLDQDALANLTPEEREAFDDPEAVATSAATDDGTDDSDDGNPDEVLDANGKPVDVPAATEKAADPAPAAAVDTPAPAAEAIKPVEDTVKSPPVYQIADTSAISDNIERLDAEEAAIQEKFNSGEFDSVEFAKELRRIGTQRAEFITEKKLNETRKADYEAYFLDRVKKDGVDYSKQSNQNLFNTFVSEVRDDNPDKGIDWYWTEAHKMVMRVRGVDLPKPTQPATTPAKPAVQNRTPPPAPKTIAHIPGGEGPGDVGTSEFAHLDALGGNDLEVAIAKMTPAQREKYSRGG